MPVAPPLFSDAETDHPAVAQWCSTILAGDTARLLLLGPHWSGKSHAAFAGLRAVSSLAGYREENSAVHRAYDLRRSYEHDVIENIGCSPTGQRRGRCGRRVCGGRVGNDHVPEIPGKLHSAAQSPIQSAECEHEGEAAQREEIGGRDQQFDAELTQ